MTTIRAVFIDVDADSDAVKRRLIKVDKRGNPPEVIEDPTLGHQGTWALRRITEDGDAIYKPA